MNRVSSSIKIRYLVCFATWFSLVAFYVHRSNISVAILEMVKTNSHKDGVSKCITPSTGPTSTVTPVLDKKPFDWDEAMKTTLLGCFFYGYAATHFVGSLISAKIGPRITLSICIAGSSLFMFLSVPLAYASPYALVAARVLSGLFSGPLYPIVHEIVGNWAPESERTFLAVATHTGNMVGLILNFGAGGYITQINEDGWKYFFYVSGGLGVISLVLWLLFAFDNPDSHPYISLEEADYICGRTGAANPINSVELDKSGADSDGHENSKDGGKEAAKKGHGGGHHHPSLREVPFKEIFSSLPIYSCYAAHFASNFILYSLLTGFTKFLQAVYGVNTTKASLLSTIPFFVCFVAQLAYPRVVDMLRKKKILKTNTLRKLSSGFGCTLSAVFLMTSTLFPCDRLGMTVAFVSISMGFWGMNTSGYFTSIIDIAPKYAGIIMGIMNTIGSVAGFTNPKFSSAIYSGKELKEGWMYAFIATGALSIGLTVPYLIFGTSDLQPWASGKKSASGSESPKKEQV